jgi:hypothetical protein
VQNDPVNFVDPSGLNMAPGGTCYAIISVTIGSESQTVTSIGFEVRCYGGGGGGGGNYSNEPGGGGGAPNAEPAQDNRSDCAKFVDNLVSRTDGTASLKATAANVGRLVGYAPKNSFSRNSKSFGISGFRDELARPDQLGDVFKHMRGQR